MPRIGNDVKFALVPEYYRKLMLVSDETARTIPWLARAFVAHALEVVIHDGAVDLDALKVYVEAGKREGQGRREASGTGEKSLIAPRRSWGVNIALKNAILRRAAEQGIPSWHAVIETAKAVGCNTNTLRQVISGRIRRPSSEVAKDLAEYLRVSVEDIFTSESTPSPRPAGTDL